MKKTQNNQEYKCIGCGNCCRERAIDIAFSDILRWSDEKRRDILREIYYIDNYPSKGRGGFYFEKSVKKKEDMKRHCSFLTAENKCSIHDTKPGGCKDAPFAYTEFKECPSFKKPNDDVINSTVKKQTQDILAAKRNFNIVMNILMGARNWQQ